MQKNHPELIVCSDNHLAISWDIVAETLKNKVNFYNPNQQLRKLIKVVNKDRNVIALINNGDLVDYYFSDYITQRGLINRESNWDLYYKITYDLNKRYEENIGNHDYRKEPYNYLIYGLRHANISFRTLLRNLDKIGHHHFRGSGELGSIIVDQEKFDPLQKYKGLRRPVKKNIGPYQCLFLNSGIDAFVKSKNTLKYLKKSLLAKWFSVDSDGYRKEDIAFIREALQEKHDNRAYIFTHAPIINSRKSHVGKEYQLSLKKFLETNARQGLAHRVVLNGGEELIGGLATLKEKNVTIIASHVHNAKYYLIEKKSLIAKEVTLCDFNKERNNPEIIKQLTTLPLGIVHPKEGKHLGYLKITPDGFEEVILNELSNQ